jgi:mono/diheme cytochrome c family protein
MEDRAHSLVIGSSAMSGRLLLILLLAIAGTAGAYFYLGFYNVAADAPHSQLVHNALETFRERSIAARSRDIKAPPDLNDPGRIAAGAGLYDEMCTGCHLGPGIDKTELAQGLYPPAPELARSSDLTPAEQFWVIKHGVKLTAMPAWGKTHDDRLIWNMVAFIRRLPRMSPEQYRAAVVSAPGSHGEMMKQERDAPAKPHSHRDGHKHRH